MNCDLWLWKASSRRIAELTAGKSCSTEKNGARSLNFNKERNLRGRSSEELECKFGCQKRSPVANLSAKRKLTLFSGRTWAKEFLNLFKLYFTVNLLASSFRISLKISTNILASIPSIFHAKRSLDRPTRLAQDSGGSGYLKCIQFEAKFQSN